MARTSVLSEFMAMAHPDPLPAPITYFVTRDLIDIVGCTRKSMEDNLESGILRASLGLGSPGKVGEEYNHHKFSERDLLVASSIYCFPPSASVERRRLSEALYDANPLHRYILVTKAAVRLFDSLSTFADPTEWSDPVLHIIDLRTLWTHMEERYARIAVRNRSVPKVLTTEDKFSGMTLPSGESTRRVGK